VIRRAEERPMFWVLESLELFAVKTGVYDCPGVASILVDG